MIETSNINRRIGAYSVGHWHTSIFQCVVYIFQHKPLLRIQGAELVLGDVEK